MIKKIMILLLASLSMLSLIGCSSDKVSIKDNQNTVSKTENLDNSTDKTVDKVNGSEDNSTTTKTNDKAAPTKPSKTNDKITTTKTTSLENIKNIKGFSLIENQSFMVNLNSWGDVRFVSGKLTAGNHVPVVFYLTNKDGDILYDFNAVLPYSVDVKSVSFQDINKDGLKDVIIIVASNYPTDLGDHVATVYFQKKDGTFNNDAKLNSGINDSGNNKDISTITKYLSKKF